MSNIQLQIKGQKKLAKIARNLADAKVRDQLSKAVKTASFTAERGIKLAITRGPTKAIDTGFMRASTRVTSFRGGEAARATVGPTADYAIYVHEGWGSSRNIGPRPFIPVGWENEKEKVERIMNKAGLKIAVNILK